VPESVPPNYIIIGAGSSGCVVFNRLSADPSVRVLLLEAGRSGEDDPAVTTPGRWASLAGSQYDWNYMTEPEAALEGRQIATPRGRAHGGSSAVNAMVHIRGHRDCFDAWQALSNLGWGYDDLLPLFKRSEHNDAGASPFRGIGGPLAVSRCLDPHAGHWAFLSAAAEQGFEADPNFDFNAPNPVGVAGFYQKNILNGRRHSTAAAFSSPPRTGRTRRSIPVPGP
jgi:choline dehydrogenase